MSNDKRQEESNHESTKVRKHERGGVYRTIDFFRAFVVTSLVFILYSVYCLLYSKYIDLTTPYLFVLSTSTWKSPNGLIWQASL
jgi:hypothetical protein